jgi:type IX secretion system PorP/SprF family membrane protein
MMRKTMRKTTYLLATFLLLITGYCNAQQYPVFSQYYFNELVINPAYAGAHVQLSATAIYRNQWVNFPGAPRTFSISAHSSVYKERIGVGVMVNVDKIGSYENKNVYGSFSYKLRFAKSTLSMGLQAGVNILGADFASLSLQNPADGSFVPLKDAKPNFGSGLYYNRKRFFVGLSIPFILNNSLDDQGFEGAISQVIEKRYYLLRSGVVLPLDRMENVKVNPSILLRSQEGQPVSLDVNTAFIFYDVFSAGVSWRSGDAFITFIDLKLSERFHFGYSYDWTSSAIRQFSSGSHEFMLNYRTPIRGLHKNAECPSFYDYR